MFSSPLASVPAFGLLGPVWASLVFWRAGVPLGAALLAGVCLTMGLLLAVQSSWNSKEAEIALTVLSLAVLLAWWCLARLEAVEDLPDRINTPGLVVGLSSRELIIDAAGQRWLVRRPQDVEVQEGQRVILEGTPVALRHSSRGWSEKLYWNARGVSARIRNAKLTGLGLGSPSLSLVRGIVRNRIKLLPLRMSGLIGALVLGDRSPSTAQDFRGWGLVHLLAVSGWHVGIVTAAALWIFGRGVAGLVLASLFTWCYVAFVGFPLSALRAACMAQVLLTGPLLGRRAFSLNGTALAMTALLCWRPASFADLGWLLSGLATLILVSLVSLGLPRKLIGLIAAPAI